MYPFPTLSHDQLLNLAHRTREAASDHDPALVGANTLQLFVALSDHVLAEHPAFLHLAPAEARIVERGQQRIIDLLRALADSAEKDADSCGCSRVADDLVVELEVQIADERRYLLAAVD